MGNVGEGYMPFEGSRTYWRVVGERTEKLPLLTLHGGPGAAHGYMTSLDDLAKGGRQVIYYDQCGCGKSHAPSNPGRWTTEFFVEELQALHKYLNLEHFHMLGHSWGGMLAICFACSRPKGLAGLVLVSSPVSIAHLKGIDLTPFLAGIDVPTLVTAGQFDHCTPKVVRILLNGISGSRSMILEKSGHLAHVEERETFNNGVEAFLAEVEAKRERVFSPATC